MVTASIISLSKCPRDFQKTVGVQARAADKESVDLRDRRKLARVLCFDAPAVENAAVSGVIAVPELSQQPSQAAMHVFDLLRRGVMAGADRPHGLVRDCD